jgi:hypothetical protein
VECLPNKADGSKSVVLDGGVKSVVAGEEAKFVVEARDLYGNRVREGGSVVNVEVRGSSTSKTSSFNIMIESTYLMIMSKGFHETSKEVAIALVFLLVRLFMMFPPVAH